ncbi:MAG: glycoside hydrolase family 3 N-terminal domain-containing protein, partial [Acidobacteriota bacterium]
ESEGVPGCLKHFPGHGRARLDSHVDMPRISARRSALRKDLSPYATLCRATRAVMVAHCTYPALDPSGVPATLSRAIVTDLLRGDLGHDGLAVADDMEMGAIVKSFGMADACRLALDAGNDILLVCYTPAAIMAAIEVSRGRATRRVRSFAASLPPPPRRFEPGLFEELLRDLGR